jgi:hypothetical protein
MFAHFRTRFVIYATVAVLLFQATVVHAALVTFSNTVGTVTTLITFANLANNARSAAGATYDPIATGLGYRLATVECALTFASAPTAGSTVDVWLTRAPDGTNFEDAATTRTPDVVCPVVGGVTTTRVSFSDVRLPPHLIKGVALNNNSGVQLNSGTVKLWPYTQKGS